jgi:hypothetical protein
MVANGNRLATPEPFLNSADADRMSVEVIQWGYSQSNSKFSIRPLKGFGVLDDGQGFLFASIPISCAMTLIGKLGDVITHLDEAKFNQGHQIVLADGRAGPLAAAGTNG